MKQNVRLLRNQRPEPISLTREKFEELQRDQQRFTREQAETLVRLQTAREMGDLSENGAYKYAKFELGNVRRKLRNTNYLLRYGVIRERTTIESVDFGCVVTIDDGKKQLEFMLVSKHESNPTEKKLSTDSPIGRALLGKKIGDEAVVAVPAGEVRYKVKAIK